MANLPLKPDGRSLSDFEPLFNNYPAEKILLEACRTGKVADISKERPNKAIKQNTVRASFVRFLALGGDEFAPVHENGVRLWGAWIKDELNLEGTFLPHSLELINCHLITTAILQDCHIHGFISFNDCHINGLTADRMVCSGSVFLSGTFTTTKTIRLQGAQIGSNLECDGGEFRGNGDDALKCENAVITGSVFLRDGFNAFGRVSMIGAQIGGSLDCRGAVLNGKQSGKEHVGALTCDSAVIKGSVFLTDSYIPYRLLNIESVLLLRHFVATATVRFLGAQIGGNLECSGAMFMDTRSGEEHIGALVCDSAVIRGAVLLNEKFTAKGRVSMNGVQIGKDLNCRNSTFEAPKSAELKDYALIAQGMTVAGIFMFGGKRLLVKDKVSLSTAKVGSLADDNKAWQNIELELDGFVYDRLAGNAPTDAKNRLAWLDKQSDLDKGIKGKGKNFKPQPWRQLQKVLHEMGHVEDARLVAIAFEERLREANLIGQKPESWSIYRNICRSPHWLLGRIIRRFGYHQLRLLLRSLAVLSILSWNIYRIICRVLHRAFGLLVGYGYRPLRLFLIMLSVWLICGLIYWGAAKCGNGVFAPSNPLVFQNSEYDVCKADKDESKFESYKLECRLPTTKGAGNWYLCEKLREEYTGFSPLAYSLDLILPLVDLQQEHDWSPMIPTPKISGLDEFSELTLKHITRLVMWFEILFGWIGSLLLVAVVSGLTKRREE